MFALKSKLPHPRGGRSLTTDIETINLDDDSITWHYSATKESETKFNYGATSDSILPKDGIVTLSQGDWTISLRGIKDGKKVYDGTTSKVTIKWNFYEPNVTVPVPVNENTGDKGFIVLTDVKIKVGESEITPNYASIDGIEITNLNGSYMKIECAPGTHSVTFAYKEGTSLFGKETITVEVKSGLETKVIGYIDGTESSGSGESQTTVMQPIEGGVKTTEPVIVEASVTPATTSTPRTKITFEAGSFTKDSTDAVLNLSVTSAGGEFSVTSSSGSSPVAGIDISLLVNGNEVKEFNGKEVVIETYIAKNLTNVVVKYNGTDGDQPIATDDESAADKTVATVLTSSSSATALGYNPNTGLLRFKTNHFSEYYVVSDSVEAINVTTNTAYTSFSTALNKADAGATIILLKDITGNKLSVTKSMTIEGNKHTLTDDTNGGRALWITDTGVSLTINDLTIDGKGICERGLQVNNLGSVWNNAEIILNNCTVKNMTYYAINLASGTTVNMVINDSYISGWAAINAYGTGNTITVNRSRLVGINDKSLSNWNNFATICLEGDTTGHTTIGSSDYQVIINDSTIEAKQTTGNKQRAIGFNSNSMNCSVSLNNTKIVLGDEEKCTFANDTGIGNKIIINGELIYESPEANCWYSNGNFEDNKESGGMFTNLLLPFTGKWLKNQEGIILKKSIELKDDITCEMTNGTFYFYVGEYELTGGSIILKDNVSVICDKKVKSLFKTTEGNTISEEVLGNNTFKYSVISNT